MVWNHIPKYLTGYPRVCLLLLLILLTVCTEPARCSDCPSEPPRTTRLARLVKCAFWICAVVSDTSAYSTTARSNAWTPYQRAWDEQAWDTCDNLYRTAGIDYTQPLGSWYDHAHCTRDIRINAYWTASGLTDKTGTIAKYMLADEYFRTGERNSGDDSVYLTLLRQSASEGYDHAQFLLGQFYYSGFLVSCDKKRAFKLFKRAAMQYNHDALYFIISSYLRGQTSLVSEDDVMWCASTLADGNQEKATAVVASIAKWPDTDSGGIEEILNALTAPPV